MSSKEPSFRLDSSNTVKPKSLTSFWLFSMHGEIAILLNVKAHVYLKNDSDHAVPCLSLLSDNASHFLLRKCMRCFILKFMETL